MAEEATGFDEQEKQKIQDDMIDRNEEVRAQAEEKFMKFGRTFGPSPVDLNTMHKRYYDEGGFHHQLLQTCGVCGSKDFQQHLRCKIFPLDDSFMIGRRPIRLNAF